MISKLITDADKKAKKIFFEVKSLRLELEILNDDQEKNENDFRRAVNDYVRLNNLKSARVIFDEPDINVPKSALKVDCSDNLKKMYKQISMKTHPDKTKNFPKSYQDLMKKYHEQLSKGFNSNCPSVIIDIAQKLDLEEINLGIEEYMTLQGEKEELLEKIKIIKNTYSWRWSNSGKDIKWIKLFLGV